MTAVRYVKVDTEHSGQRLDNYLKTVLKGVPLSRIYRIIRRGEVRVNKGRVRPSNRLQTGDMIRIPPIRQTAASDLSTNSQLLRWAENLQGSVIYEDDVMLVINKPAGIAVHGGSGLPGGVIEALRLQAFATTFIELVHRLDRQTSGCLVLARSRTALLDLQQQIGGTTRSATKHYLALLRGHWQGGERRIRCKMLNTRQLSGERMVIVSDFGKTAESIFSPLSCSDVCSLLKIELLTGRTHQARVHAAACGMPIAGDEKYGDRGFNQRIQRYGLHRLFLHASSIRIRHPKTGKSMQFRAPLPMELQSPLLTLGMDFKI